MNLDSVDFAKIDPDNMRARVSELPQQCQDAWGLVRDFALPAGYRDAQSVAILGMGGSAIGGDLARGLAQGTSSAPITVVREYDIPGYVSKSTLVVASSFSGNTEETLAGLDEALRRGAKCVGVGTGGKLERRCQEAGIPFLKFTYESSPRAALGYSLICMAGLLRQAGLLELEQDQLDEAISVMRGWQKEIGIDVPMAKNAAKQLAGDLHGRVPVVYGSGLFSDVARRWKGNFNENSKAWSFFEVMPELNHNAVLGYRNPTDLQDKLMVIMLRGKYDHQRVSVRYDVTGEILREAGIRQVSIQARGDSPLAQMLSIIHFGDYVTLYLAYAYQSDPTPIPAINFLKDRLAKA